MADVTVSTCDVNTEEEPPKKDTGMETENAGDGDCPVKGQSGGSVAFKVPSLSKVAPAVEKTKKALAGAVGADASEGKSAQVQDEKEVQPNRAPKDSESQKPKTSKSFALSPAEQLKQTQVVIPYKEPSWSGIAEEPFNFEVLKNGTIIDNINLNTKPYYVIGRLPSCDVQLEHPSLSRYHAVVQYRAAGDGEQEPGWYLYDMDSTHGTWINKHKVPPKVYFRIRVGYVLKFGGSTRHFILQGPSTDQEEESALSVAELKEQRERQKREAELLRLAEQQEQQQREEQEQKKLQDIGCSWGMEDDAEEESEENPFANVLPENENLYLDDPKKTLKGYFEREGFDPPEYVFVDIGSFKKKCQVELPIDGPDGRPVTAEVTVTGKKKDAVVACALEACRVLDRHGVLRKAVHESHKRKEKNWEDADFYDSDEDTFLDRTGTIEKKRQLRMKKAGKLAETAENYTSLMEKHSAVAKEIAEIEEKLEAAKAQAAAFDNEEEDALDAYMSAIKAGVMDTKTKMRLKRQLLELRQEEARLRRLVNIARPASLPPIAVSKPPVKPASSEEARLSVPVRKIRAPDVPKPARVPQLPSGHPTSFMASRGEEEVEEEEEDEEEEDSGDSAKQQPPRPAPRGASVEAGSRQSAAAPSSPQRASSEPSSSLADDPSGPKVRGPRLGPGHAVPGPAEVEGEPDSTTDLPVKGPTLPPDLPGDNEVTASSSTEVESSDAAETRVKKRKATQLVMTETLKKARETAQAEADSGGYDASDPDFAVWMPPKGQSGDGRTHLNDKYGY